MPFNVRMDFQTAVSFQQRPAHDVAGFYQRPGDDLPVICAACIIERSDGALVVAALGEEKP